MTRPDALHSRRELFVLAWYCSLTHLQRTVVTLAAIGLLTQVVYSTIRAETKTSDFTVNRDFGIRFLSGGDLYEGGGSYNYMPISGLFYVPLAVAPPWLGMLGRSLVALVCIGLTLRWLSRMAPEMNRSHLVVASIALFLSVQYLQRDFDDGGPHVFYVALLIGGAYAVWLGRQSLAAGTLGLAIALKMTPGLMLGLFVWKRQWRLATLTAAATAGWILLPALFMGFTPWWQAQQKWIDVVATVASGNLTKGMIENDFRVQNQSLKMAVQHVLVTYAEGHTLWLGYGDWSVLDLEPKFASRIATIVTFASFGVFCLLAVRPSPPRERDPRWSHEWAGLMVMMLLLSPVTWVQHMVWVIPAVYLTVATAWSERPGGRWATRILAAYAVIAIALNRGVVGPEASWFLQVNHISVISMVLLLGLLAWSVRTRPANTVALPTRITSEERHAA